ncbi:PRUNE [Enterospora canceri]|uniref:inorganic diphosphatase n=1 Tax=Enterospora canceri TaxID=1081671 RepID=A0A1Y1S8Z4_9MICR|nr:PRUNE [Enterospora canceri]
MIVGLALNLTAVTAMDFHDKLKEYFGGNKRRLAKERDVTLCLGNEACDVDSFISSLVTAIHDNAIHVVCMNRDVFEAKGDVGYVLDHFGIDRDDLVYLERPIGNLTTEQRRDVTRLNTYEGGRLKESRRLSSYDPRLIIVDHNVPVDELKEYTIDLIVDHHELARESIRARRMYIDLDVGSCSTLISKYIGHSLTTNKANKSSDFESATFVSHIAKMLLVPIVLDTSNFKRRASHFDLGEFERLLGQSSTSRKELLAIRKGIRKGRLNDEGLPNDIIMQKDFKVYHHRGLNFGCATVKYKTKKWVERELKKNVNMESYLNDFRRRHGLDFLFVNRKKGRKRWLTVVNCTFEKMLAEENGFKAVEYKGLHYYKIDVKLSRKVMMPIVLKTIDRIYKKMKKRGEAREKEIETGLSLEEIRKELDEEKREK